MPPGSVTNDESTLEREAAVSGSFYAPPESCDGRTIRLPAEEVHHAFRARRLRPDEEIIVVDGTGGWYRAVVEGSRTDARGAGPRRPADAGFLSLTILEERREVGESPWHLTLAQAVGKGRKFELVVEKGTELGVSTFIPLSTDREIVTVSSAGLERRRQRWQRIAHAAL